MRKLHFSLVDVFTNQRFGGNQLAVFTNGRGLDQTVMQQIAREINFSESTFIFPPEDAANDYKVRIFTPFNELPMAGHPTIGTSYILVREHMVNREKSELTLRLEEGVGVVPVTLKLEDGLPSSITMQQPLPKFGPEFTDKAAIAELLSLDTAALVSDLPVEVVSCGVPFLFIPLKNLEAIRAVRIKPDLLQRTLSGFATSNLFCFTTEVENEGSKIHCRMFAPGMGVPEDPATGSANGPLGCYLVQHKVLPFEGTLSFTSEQGIEMGRPSFMKVQIEQKDGAISSVSVGGECYYVGEGVIELD